jgi:transcription antitermination factor NusG
MQATLKPQFPTYIFAGLEPGKSTQEILTTVGVRDILRNGLEIVIVAERQFEDIRRRCDERHHSSSPKLADVKLWRPGDVVPMPYGPFIGLPVQIRTIDKSGRIGASIGSLSVTFHVFALHESVRKSSWHAQTCPG